jgi:hypothetical protein
MWQSRLVAQKLRCFHFVPVFLIALEHHFTPRFTLQTNHVKRKHGWLDFSGMLFVPATVLLFLSADKALTAQRYCQSRHSLHTPD